MHAGKIRKVATKYVFIFIFWSRCCCVLLLLPTTSVLKRREVPATVSSFSVSATTAAVSFASILLLLLRLRRDACRKKQTKNTTFSFLVAALLLLFTHREGCAEKNKVGFCFVFDTGTQSNAVSVTRYLLLLFLTAPGSCCRRPCRPAFMCVSCYRLLQRHPAWSNGAMEHLDPQETHDTTRICRFRTTSPVQGVRT